VPESASGVQQHPAAPFPSPPAFVRPELCPRHHICVDGNEIGEGVRTRWLAGDVAVPFVVDFGDGGEGMFGAATGGSLNAPCKLQACANEKNVCETIPIRDSKQGGKAAGAASNANTSGTINS
jgi:hypothetical protein